MFQADSEKTFVTEWVWMTDCYEQQQQWKRTNVLCTLSAETEAHLTDHDRQSGHVDVLHGYWSIVRRLKYTVETIVMLRFHRRN